MPVTLSGLQMCITDMSMRMYWQYAIQTAMGGYQWFAAVKASFCFLICLLLFHFIPFQIEICSTHVLMETQPIYAVFDRKDRLSDSERVFLTSFIMVHISRLCACFTGDLKFLSGCRTECTSKELPSRQAQESNAPALWLSVSSSLPFSVFK